MSSSSRARLDDPDAAPCHNACQHAGVVHAFNLLHSISKDGGGCVRSLRACGSPTLQQARLPRPPSGAIQWPSVWERLHRLSQGLSGGRRRRASKNTRQQKHEEEHCVRDPLSDRSSSRNRSSFDALPGAQPSAGGHGRSCATPRCVSAQLINELAISSLRCRGATLRSSR